MPHSDDDDLALSALEGARAGAEPCPCDRCQSELAAYRRTVAAGRAGVKLERPAPAVWDRIAADIAAEQDGGPTSTEPADGRADPPADQRTSPWLRRSAWVAAASFALGIAGTLAVQQLTTPADPEVLAATDLDPLPGWDATGTAVVEQVGEHLELVIELPDGTVDGYREVWLIDRDVRRLVSVGVLTAGEGRFPLPRDLDLEEFPIVDVSREPLDGDPAHSGDSIVRGELT